jgi:hypothetical protein
VDRVHRRAERRIAVGQKRQDWMERFRIRARIRRQFPKKSADPGELTGA